MNIVDINSLSYNQLLDELESAQNKMNSVAVKMIQDRLDALCHADPPNDSIDKECGPNYGKPHVPVAGIYDSELIKTCLFCGKRLYETDSESFDKT